MSRIDAEARDLLLRRRDALRAQTARRASAAPAKSDFESVPDGVRRELLEIEGALTRIAEGRYGSCLRCGGPMGLQRIRAIPEARYCVTCSGSGEDD